MQYGIDSGKIMTTILTIIPPLEPDFITPGGIQAARLFLPWASERGYKTVFQKLLEEDLYFKSPFFFEEELAGESEGITVLRELQLREKNSIL